MPQERREDERVAPNLTARWDGLSGAYQGRIEDISLGGCFVNTRGGVSPGEMITLEIRLPPGEWLQLRGEVTSYHPAMGFGLVFSYLTDEEQRILQQLITGLDPA